MSFVSRLVLGFGFVLTVAVCWAQPVPTHAEGLQEELLTVALHGTRTQQGVLSLAKGATAPRYLAVLLPGSPSVVRPIVDNGVMQSSQLSGNFLIRSRRHLADQDIALLVVDCHSDSGSECRGEYQASVERERDVALLIQAARAKLPSVEKVWLVGTSMGTISSSFMARYGANAYAGAIHTASITHHYGKNAYRELLDFDYAKAGIPQFFIHHRNDPCVATPYAAAQAIADKFKLPLITVSGGSGMQGPACEAYTEHGFRGREKEVMQLIKSILRTGQASQLELP